MNNNQHKGKKGEPAMRYEQASDQSSAQPRGEVRTEQPPTREVCYCNSQKAAGKQQEQGGFCCSLCREAAAANACGNALAIRRRITMAAAETNNTNVAIPVG
jgi:hypothetical protein